MDKKTLTIDQKKNTDSQAKSLIKRKKKIKSDRNTCDPTGNVYVDK